MLFAIYFWYTLKERKDMHIQNKEKSKRNRSDLLKVTVLPFFFLENVSLTYYLTPRKMC